MSEELQKLLELGIVTVALVLGAGLLLYWAFVAAGILTNAVRRSRIKTPALDVRHGGDLSRKQAAVLYAVVQDMLDGVCWNSYPRSDLEDIQSWVRVRYGVRDDREWTVL